MRLDFFRLLFFELFELFLLPFLLLFLFFFPFPRIEIARFMKVLMLKKRKAIANMVAAKMARVTKNPISIYQAMEQTSRMSSMMMQAQMVMASWKIIR